MHRSLDFTAEHLTLRASAAIGQNSCVGRVALRALECCAYRVVTDWRRVRMRYWNDRSSGFEGQANDTEATAAMWRHIIAPSVEAILASESAS
jgi:hypothetical protein